MQTGETRIRSKAMPPPNTNPMELDHVRVHVSNPFSRLSMIPHQWVYVKAGLWTGLDHGLDRGLDCGLQYGLNSGLIWDIMAVLRSVLEPLCTISG